MTGDSTSLHHCALDLKLHPLFSIVPTAYQSPVPSFPSPPIFVKHFHLSPHPQVQLRPQALLPGPLPQSPPWLPGFQCVPHVAPEVSFFTWNCPCPSLAQSPPKAPQGPGTNSMDCLVDEPGLGTYIAEGAVATQGPWLVVPVLLGILWTCGDRRAAVT